MDKITVREFSKPFQLPTTPFPGYEKIKDYVLAAQALARVANQSIYIIDYYKQGFMYVSENPLFLCGNSSMQVQNLGYLFYFKYVPESDLQLLVEINNAGFNFFNQIPFKDRLQYSITYDFHLKQPQDRLILVNHRLTPLVLDQNHNMWLALCIVSPSSNDTSGNIYIRKIGQTSFFEYDREQSQWNEKNRVKLNRQEREIIMLSIQGYTMEEIAHKIYISVPTVKFHKSNLFKKLNVKNMSEAVAFAINYNLI